MIRVHFFNNETPNVIQEEESFLKAAPDDGKKDASSMTDVVSLEAESKHEKYG